MRRSAAIFEGLNELPWAYLTHAYGSAAEVPMWLRQLTPSLVHGAFRPEVIIYNARAQAISGIVGFTHAAIGDPAYDLAGLFGAQGYSKTFIERVAEKYPPVLVMWKRAAFYVTMRSMEDVLS